MELTVGYFSSDDVPVLTAAEMFAYPDATPDVTLVVLRFGAFAVSIRVDADTDTLIRDRGRKVDLRSDELIQVNNAFWRPVLGWALSDAWHMMNDDGYLDAMQLRFRQHPSAGPYKVIQMCALASRIALAELRSHPEAP